VREFFGPAESGAADGAINPLDPDVMFAQGCEWRIDRKTGVAKCLGVVTREHVDAAAYVATKNADIYLVMRTQTRAADVFERVGDGNYKKISMEDVPNPVEGAHLQPPINSVRLVASQGQAWGISTEDGFVLSNFFESSVDKIKWPKLAAPGADMTHAGIPEHGSITQGRDGKLYMASGGAAYWSMEITGLDKVKALAGGKLTVPAAK